MIRCLPSAENRGATALDRLVMKLHGAENSPLKNSAPSSLTARNTSESTSISIILLELGASGKNTGRLIKYSSPCWLQTGSEEQRKEQNLCIPRRILVSCPKWVSWLQRQMPHSGPTTRLRLPMERSR